MSFMRYMLFAVFLLSLAGCSTTGTRVDGQKLSAIQKGETTEAEVIALLGKPDSVTVTPERKILRYKHQQSNSTSSRVASSTGSLLGGVVAGSLGSMAGGLIAGSAVPTTVQTEQLSIEIDTATQKVLNYQHQRSSYD